MYRILVSFIILFPMLVYSASVKEHSSGKVLYDWSGEYLQIHSNGKKLLQYDGEYIKQYSSGKKLYKWDGQYVSLYSSGKKIIKIDGKKFTDYSTGKQITCSYDFVGTVPLPIMALLCAGYI